MLLKKMAGEKYLVLSRVLPGSGDDGGSDTDSNGSVRLPVGGLSPPTTRRGPTHIQQVAYKGRMSNVEPFNTCPECKLVSSSEVPCRTGVLLSVET